MHIGELARRCGVSTSKVRFLEARGIIDPAFRKQNGYRDYPGATADRLMIVLKAQKLGFSLEEIRAFFAPPRGQDEGERIVSTLEAKLNALNEHLESLKRGQRLLADLIEEQKRCIGE